MENTTPHKPDGLIDLEKLHSDLLSISINDNSTFSAQILNNLIMQVESIITKLNFNPRLPLYQIEKEITEICQRDKSTQGVVVKFLFATKFGNIDNARLSHFKVNI